MTRGGKREGAGRKQGSGNFLTNELRGKIKAEGIIDFLQRIVEGKVKGATISERKDAAVALLKKVLPDCRQTEIAQQQEPINIKVVLTGDDVET